MNVSSPQLVLLPGLDGTGILFRDFIAAISEEFTTTVVQYPNEPASYNELAALVSKHIPLRPLVLIAESFSTPLAIQIAATHPENLRALVLCVGFVQSPLHGVQRAMALALAPLMFRMRLPSFAIRYALVGMHATDELVQLVRTAIASVPAAMLAHRFRLVLRCDRRGDLAQITVPMLYIAAKRDRLIANASRQQIHTLRPDVTLAEIDGPHLILQSEPARSAKIIADYVRELPQTWSPSP